MTKMATPVEHELVRNSNKLASRTEAKGGIDPARETLEAPAPKAALEQAVCMGFDAFRICIGIPPKQYTR